MTGNSANWKDIAELFGIAAIVASLIFVGLQMKQTQEIALAQAYQARSDASANSSFAIIQSPEALAALSRIQSGQSIDFKSPEALALCQWITGIFFIIDNSFYQYQLGFLPESHWARVRSTVKQRMRESPNIRAACRVDENLHEDFIQEMDKIFAEIDQEGRKPE